MTTFTCISDMHGELPDLAEHEADFLLIGGDNSYLRSHAHHDQMHWMERNFGPWLEQQSKHFKHIVGISGNHDLFAEKLDGRELLKSMPWNYLEDNSVVLDGLKFHGSPYSVTYFDWAFMKDDLELAPHWQAIDDNTDVLLVHGPPAFHCDKTFRGPNVGSETLNDRLWQLPKLKLVVCGHIHEAYGIDADPELRDWTVVNAAQLRLHGGTNPPIRFEF